MFDLTEEDRAKIKAWQNENEPMAYSGAIGGRYTYMFTNTSLGCVVKVRDNLKKIELDLTDYDSW
jgi:hypothetical protein